MEEKELKEINETETTEKKDAPEADFKRVSQIIMCIGVAISFIAMFLPYMYGEIAYLGVAVNKSVWNGLTNAFGAEDGSFTSAVPALACIIVAVILVLLTIKKDQTTKYIAAGIAACATAGFSVFFINQMLNVVHAGGDASVQIGYILMAVGYILVIGGAVGYKGLDSFSTPDDEEEENTEETGDNGSEESKEDSVESKDEKETQKED